MLNEKDLDMISLILTEICNQGVISDTRIACICEENGITDESYVQKIKRIIGEHQAAKIRKSDGYLGLNDNTHYYLQTDYFKNIKEELEKESKKYDLEINHLEMEIKELKEQSKRWKYSFTASAIAIIISIISAVISAVIAFAK